MAKKVNEPPHPGVVTYRREESETPVVLTLKPSGGQGG